MSRKTFHFSKLFLGVSLSGDRPKRTLIPIEGAIRLEEVKGGVSVVPKHGDEAEALNLIAPPHHSGLEAVTVSH